MWGTRLLDATRIERLRLLSRSSARSFQKYRGLKSFRTSPWDPKENLPRDYARIFQFQDFSRTRKHVFRQLEKEEIDGAAVSAFPLPTYSLPCCGLWAVGFGSEMAAVLVPGPG